MPTAANLRLLLSAAFALLLFAAPAFAKDTVKITGVAVGFPSAAKERDDCTKFGAWAPVYVTLETLGDVTTPTELVIEAPDADELTTVLTVPLNLTGVSPGTKVFAPDRGCVGYVRPASAASEITITVKAVNGDPISEPFRVRMKPREPLQYVVLALGGTPNTFELPKLASSGADQPALRNGRVELTTIAEYARLPDQWLGYDAADLVILHTNSPADFLTRLFGSKDAADVRKRQALLEWARRGGRLVVSVGASAKLASELPEFAALVPFAVNPASPTRSKKVADLTWAAGASQVNVTSVQLDPKNGPPLVFANLQPQPGRAARELIPAAARKADSSDPVAVQSAFGLGRVTLIGFDLDRAPFTEPKHRTEFWDWLLRECGSARGPAGGDGKPRPPGALTEDEDEAAVAVRTYNDSFEGVAVVSFGWIAVLIVLYILLIGPVEYYFLKRVLGRLELTWATFPIIVITVSLAAYLSADSVKGRELKVNRLDVVDVDGSSGRAYGTTWFTVFSPKIDNYTLTVEASDGWGADDSHPAVNWLGAPRGGRPGVVRRKYGIRADGSRVADQLSGVPIQVWSTKAFVANWTSNGPKLESQLVHPPGDRTKVIGTFTSNLPAPVLTDCVAFYAGQAYPIPGGAIAKGERVRIMFDQGTAAVAWFQQTAPPDALLNLAQAYRDRPNQKGAQKTQQAQPFSGPLPMWTVLFHEATLKNEEGVIARNASLRRLDQSWRFAPDNRSEVIVVGRAVPQYGPAEEVLNGPNAPSKLWLKGDRAPVRGTARQETWVRFYLPVR